MNPSAAVTLWLILLSSGGAKEAPTTSFASTSKAAQMSATSTAPTQAADAPADAAKDAAIRKLLDLTGASKLMSQTIGSMTSTMRPLILSSLPAGEYRERLVDLFFERFQTKLDAATLVNLMVPIYAKHLSRDEIEGLIQFYRTPLGQKTLSVLPQIVSESQLAGKEFGEKAGRDSMMEVFQEHPDLRQAVETAAAATKKQ